MTLLFCYYKNFMKSFPHWDVDFEMTPMCCSPACQFIFDTKINYRLSFKVKSCVFALIWGNIIHKLQRLLQYDP